MANSGPNEITAGPNGNLWFTEQSDKIGRITLTGVITEYAVPTTYSGTVGITFGSDGNLWFTEYYANQLGRLTPTGSLTEFPLPTSNSQPAFITTGPEGSLWFTELNANRIGRLLRGIVVNAANSHFSVSAPYSSAAATPLSVTVTALDPNGNTARGYRGTAHFTSSDANAMLPADYAFTAGDSGVHTFTLTFRTVGDQTLVATDTVNSTITGARGSFTEFPIPGAPILEVVATGPDGNVWFTEIGANQIGRITPAGSITEFSIPTAGSRPLGIARGPDGNLWFTESQAGQIGRITPTGTVTEFSVPTSSLLGTIVAGPDGNLWFTELKALKIGRITPTGTVTEYSIPAPATQPQGITAGPDGNLWFDDVYGNYIGRITTSGAITEFPVPTAKAGPEWITNGPDGNLWFTEDNANQVGRITTSGVVSEFPVGPSATNSLQAIRTGPDGNLWVTGSLANQIIRITPAGTVTGRFDIPTSNSYILGLTVGAEGNFWFAEQNANQIGRFTLPIRVTRAATPKIDIRSPANNAEFAAGTSVLVSGFASAPVTVDGKPVDVLDPSGNFFTRVIVAPGENIFHFVATDSLGQTASATLTLEGGQKPAIDFSLFSDVSASFNPEYARTSFNEDSKILFADVAVRNTGNYSADAPFIVEVKNISDPHVRIRDAAGFTPDGIPYYDFTPLVQNGTLAPAELTGAASIAFFNPDRVQFTYDLVFLGKLNQAPAITSIPVVEAIAGKPYRYAASATDPDSDPLAFSLTTQPAGMAVDRVIGQITWSPGTSDIGTHSVTLRVEDGRGGFAEQRYVVMVKQAPPNRPPVFTSVPVVNANVNTAYVYQVTATDPDSDPLTFTLTAGPQGMAIDSTSGLATWRPAANEVGTQDVTLSVSDGQGGTAMQAFVIQVEQEPGNHPPVIVSDPVTVAYGGHSYTYDVHAIDPDNDPLTYSLTKGPVGMRIDSRTGAVSWPIGGGTFAEFPILTPSYTEHITTSPDGNVWFTESGSSGGSGTNKIGRITPSGIMTEFSIPTPNSGLDGITTGPDGNLWFVERFANQIGRITPTGTVTEFPIPSANSESFMIVAGPDGNLWFTEAGVAGKIGRITPTGTITEFPVGAPHDQPEEITAGPDGNLWFSEVYGNKIGRITPTGTITEYAVPTANAQPEWITTGPDGNLWFIENVNKVGRISVSGAISEFQVGPSASNNLGQIITGPDGNLWVTGYFLDQLLRISPAGIVTGRFDIPTSNPRAIGITVGADGNLWFAESNANQIGRFPLPISGTFPTTVRADDGRGGFDTQSFAIDVEPNRPPVIVSPPATKALEGNLYTYNVVAVDPDNDPLTYSLPHGPAGMTIDPVTGVVNWPIAGRTFAEFHIAGAPNPEFITTGRDGNAWFTDLPSNNIGRLTPAGIVTEFALPTANSGLDEITTGPDGNLWFVERFANQIGRISPTGTVTEFPIPSANSESFMIVTGPDGNLWFTEAGVAGKIGRITPTGTVSEFPVGAAHAQPEEITAGPDGNLWFSEVYGNKIGRITPTGTVTEFPVPTANAQPEWITTGPDGNLWFIENVNKVGRISVSGVISEFQVGPSASNNLGQIITGPDGNLWVTGYFLDQLLRISPAGIVTGRFDIPTSNARAIGITVGADGNLWFAESNANQIGRFALSVSITVRADDGLGGFDTQSFAITIGDGIPGEIDGTSFSDISGNGQRDAGEPGLASWTIYLDQNQNGQRDPGETLTTTDANGNYAFMNLIPGSYRVAEEVQPDWEQTAPAAGFYDVTIVSGQVATGNDFGNKAVAQGANRPPRFTSSPPSTATADQTLRYPATAIDPDHDPLTYDLVVKPAGMVLQPSTGLILWAPTAEQIGSQGVIIRVQDGRGGVDLQSFQVTVSRANSAPVITSTPGTQAMVGQPYQYQVRAQDADGDPITFQLDLAPTGMRIAAVSGLLTWTPAANQAGSQHVTVSASDGRGGTTTQVFDVSVVDSAPNDPPAITSTPRGTIGLGSTYRYAVVATDPDGDPLTYSLATAPGGMTIDGAGLVLWQPTAGQLGPNSVQVRVDDGRGGFATQAFSVSVVTQRINRPPSIVSVPELTAVAGKQYAYDPVGTDPDGDPLSWSLGGGPAGMSIDAGRGTLRWIPAADQLGSQDVVVRVTDGQGGFATQSFTITVQAVNRPPLITSTPPTEAAVGTGYSYAVRATDPDNNPVFFSLTTAPGGMTIDAGNGLILWTPAANQLGPQDIALRVDDGEGGFATQTYTVVVSATAPNQPPVITSTPAFVATVGDLYQYAVMATDSEGQTLQFSLQAGPAGMSIDAASGLVRWTPALDQVGTQPVTVAAFDPAGAAGTQSFAITVFDADNPPTITSTPLQVVTAGLPYHYDVQAGDPDGDPITFSLLSGPAGMQIDSFGRVTWAPAIADIGTHRIDITVADNRGLSVTQSYDLAVLADTQSPRVSLSLSANPADLGSAVTFVVSATDNVGVQSLTLTVAGTPIALDRDGRATVTMNTVGQFDIVASASDAAGNTGLATTTLSVIDTSDVNAPVVELTAPADDAVITHPVDVLGTASDDNLLFYTLEVARLGSDSFTEMVRGSSSVVNGVLGKFDPSGLANDTYILRLTATDAGGNVSRTETQINVAGDLKLGNFTLSFTDLSIPVSGIPITVGRTYDSLNAGTSSDFGFGWRLEFRDTNLRTSVPPTGEEDIGVYNPFRQGTRVYVTLPGGKREGFTFAPQLQSGFGRLFGFYNAAFIPDAGVTSQLSVPDTTTLIQAGPEFYALFNEGSLPYNPADTMNFAGSYTLTTKEGIAYSIDAVTGELHTIADAHANSLAFSDAGIDSSTGQHVLFDRDPQGRIVGVTDSMGNHVHYRYDSSGDLVAVTDREGNVTQFGYSAAHPHFLEQVIDPLGRTGVRTEYDAQGRLKRLIDAAGNPVQLAYDPDHSLETVTDALGKSTLFEYDERGNVVTEVNAAGGITRRTYDDVNNMLSETDPLGHTMAFSYDTDGNILTQTDPLGNVTRSTYVSFVPSLLDRFRGARAMTLLATTTDPLGTTTVNSYDNAGNLLSTTDAAGNVTHYAYDSAGNQTSMTDAAGNVTHFEYDSGGHLTRQADTLGHTTLYTYDANGNQLTQMTTVTGPARPRTLITATSYDHNGHPLSVTDAEGSSTRTEYDALGHQSATIDGLGRRTEFVYDERGQLVETRFADGTNSTLEYDAAGRRIASTDRAGRTTHFVYDDLGRLTATIYPDATPDDLSDNPRTQTEYDAAGRVTAQIDELGHRTEFAYDAAGRQTVVRDALGHETASAYDAAGRKSAVTDALGHTTQFIYDALGREVQTLFVDAATTSKSYDPLGRVIVQVDQAGHVTRFEYDPLGRLTAVVDALDQRTEYGYDEAGNLVLQRDANAHVTRYEYDGLGRRTATILPLGQRSVTSYDAAGNIATTTDFNGQTIRYGYDSTNRLLAKHFPDGTSVTFTYMATGQRQSVVDFRGTTIYAYDERDRLVSRTDPDGRMIAYTYDAAGNRTSVTIPSGTTFYTFDVLNRQETVTDPQGGVTHYSYDAASNLVETDLPNHTIEFRNYDNVNRLVFLENSGPMNLGVTQLISSYRYTLDPTGNRIAVQEDTGRRVDYGYDALYRLIGEAITDPANGNRTINYTYDPVGNRLTRDDSGEGLTAYSYDENDRLLTETLAGVMTRYGYDNNGNTLSRVKNATDQVFYQWNTENRLIGADITDASGTKHVDYQYDANGIRVTSTVNGEETRFLIDTVQPYAQVLLEYRPSGLVVASYVYGNRLISQSRGGVWSFFHLDGLGSTRALTDAGGVVIDRDMYDAFGQAIVHSGNTTNSYQFATEQHDSVGDVDYLRARYLDPKNGRFLALDSFAPELSIPGTLNRYVYVRNNPVNWTDPSGTVTLTEVVLTVSGYGNTFYVNGVRWPSRLNSNADCAYSVTRREFTCPRAGIWINTFNANIYSGTGQGRNNPGYELVRDIGPIPRGVWEIGPPIALEGYVWPVFRLTYVGIPYFQREGFLIHGANFDSPNDSSIGCIVISPVEQRVRIMNAQVRTLMVTT